MLTSKDGLIRVDQVASLASIVFPPSAWSVMNLPTDPADAQAMYKNLFNTPTARHVSLALCRHRRKERLAATANVVLSQDAGWSYLDTVSLWYEKPSTCSNNGLLPVAEPGFLLYKGDTPDAKRTSWFGEKNAANATNLWNLATQEEEDATWSYYQKFSWEMNMLLMSLATPLEHTRFIYGMPLAESDWTSVFKFCKHFLVGVQLYVKAHDEAEAILAAYEKFLKNPEK
jgi:hypothetical protein